MAKQQEQQQPELIDLDELNRLILEAETTASATVAHAGYRIQLCTRIGRALNGYRQSVPHGEWLGWVDNKLPGVTVQTLRKWMKLAESVDSGRIDLDDAKSVRQAYILAGILPEPEESPSSNAPGETNYLVHLDRFEAAMRNVEVIKLSTAEKQQLAQRLKPVAELYGQLLSTP